jgi:hypothetical protein
VNTCPPGYYGTTCSQLCVPTNGGACTGAYTFAAGVGGAINVTTGCATGSVASAGAWAANVSTCAVGPQTYPSTAACGLGFLVASLTPCGRGPNAACCAGLARNAGQLQAQPSANCLCDPGTYNFVNGYISGALPTFVSACASYFSVTDIPVVGSPQCPSAPVTPFVNATACPVVAPSPSPAVTSFRVAVITDNHLVDDCYPCANDLLLNYGNQGSALGASCNCGCV